MYSYEDRIRAVELYIKLGKRTSPTIRQQRLDCRWDMPLGSRNSRRARRQRPSSTTSHMIDASLPP